MCGLMDSSNTVIMHSFIDAKQLSYNSAQEDLVSIDLHVLSTAKCTLK